MGFLCINRDNKKIVSQIELTEQEFMRDIGLNNVYNLQPEINVCKEIFHSPQFYVIGATKLSSGITTTLTGCTTGTTIAVYNLDYTPAFDITFILTGSTDYTGYTGNFCYKTFPDYRFIAECLTGNTIIDLVGPTAEDCIPFSAITATTLFFTGYTNSYATYTITGGEAPNVISGASISINHGGSEEYYFFDGSINNLSLTAFTDYIVNIINNDMVAQGAPYSAYTSNYVVLGPPESIDITVTSLGCDTDYNGAGVTNWFIKFSYFGSDSNLIYFSNSTTAPLTNATFCSGYTTTTSVVKEFVDGSLSNNWAEYLIRPYYTFESKDCNPGYVFNSWESTQQLNCFDSQNDYYFMTVKNPPTPIISSQINKFITNNRLVTDKLYVDGKAWQRGPQAINNSLNYFILSYKPFNNDIVLILNGVQLTKGYDFNLIQQGFAQPPMVELLGEVKSTDWLVATYIFNENNEQNITNFGIYFIDTIKIDGFTSTATPTYRIVGDNTINYNPTTTNYEFFTTSPVDPTYSTMLSVNGVKMVENEQYFKSTSFDGRIIFDKNNTSFTIGDVISVLAVSKDNNPTGNNFGTLSENNFLIQWSVPTVLDNKNVTGRFNIEVFDDNTNALLYQGFVDFEAGQPGYTYSLTSLSLNLYYRFRVTFEATYHGYLNNNVTTCSYSEGYFDTTSRYINNTY